MLKKAISFVVLILVFSNSYAQNGIKGRVVDDEKNPLKGALVKLINANKSQTTDSLGNFFFETASSIIPRTDPVFHTISFSNGILTFNSSENLQKIRIEVFDIKGNMVNQALYQGITKGNYSMEILPDNLPVAMYFVKLHIDNRSSVFNVISLKNRTCSVPGKMPSFGKSIVKKSAVLLNSLDSLQVSKNYYDTAGVAITSYIAELTDIVLKSKGLPPVVNGQNANTTRYWDCCEPHCGWRTNMRLCDINGNTVTGGARDGGTGCNGGSVFQCMDYSPFAVNSKLSFAWVAFNNGGNQCADCYQLDLQDALSGKQIVVQSINVGDGGLNAFDILIPGGGVGANNGCSRQWNNAPLGKTYGGFRATCGANYDCILNMCKQAFGNRTDLMNGCLWYLDWFNMGDNPKVVYKKIPCPKEITDISGIGN